jgi:S1-C subfamily serine protease
MRKAALIIALLSPLTAAYAGEPDFGEIYARAVDSVVYICAVDREWNFSSGAGVIIGQNDGYGIIVTAYHVVADRMVGAMIPRRDKDGRIITERGEYARIPADARCIVMAVDARRDLALIKWKYKHDNLKVASLSAGGASPGESVCTIGMGAGIPFRFSGGNVRAITNEDYTYPGGQKVRSRMCLTSCPIDNGDSGGPLINKNGQVLGITSGSFTTRNQVHMAVDATEVVGLIDDAIAEGEKAKSQQKEKR